MMSHDRLQELANSFIRALRDCERNGNVEQLTALFSPKALLGNLALPHPMHGKEGARVFWQDYRHAFKEIHSHFNHVNGGGPVVALEWTSEGTLRSGKPVNYRGVSLLEFDDEESGLITRFQAYYDSVALTEIVGGHAPRETSAAA